MPRKKKSRTYEFGKDWIYIWAKPRNKRKYAQRVAEKLGCKITKIKATTVQPSFGERMYIMECKKQRSK